MTDADENKIQLKKLTLAHNPDSDQLHQNPYLIPPPPPSRSIPKKSKISIRKKKKKKKKKTQQPTKYSLCFEKYRQLLIFGYIRLNTHNFIPTDIMIYIFECY
eukprot:523134_1